MKVFPSKYDIERLFNNYHKTKTNQRKLMLKNDGSATLFTFCYLLFARQVAAETDKLLFIDRKAMGKHHVLAAGRKILPKFSYAAVIKSKLKDLKTQSDKASSTSISDNSDVEKEDE